MSKLQDKRAGLRKRHYRIRNKVTGSSERPRLAVFRSLNHISAQVIDDETGHTLASASTEVKEVREALAGKTGGNVTAATLVGRMVAVRAKDKGVTKVSFDRGGYKYHGRVKALAAAAREAGLEF
jgi:large subunit ribosomal protein L18